MAEQKNEILKAKNKDDVSALMKRHEEDIARLETILQQE